MGKKTQHLYLIGAIFLFSSASIVAAVTPKAILAKPQQIKPIHNNQTIALNIAANRFTQISINQDRIQRISGIPGSFIYRNQTKNGQVFIKPAPAYQKKPFTLFITTEKKQIYGLRLTPKINFQSTAILLKPKDIIVKPTLHWESTSSYHKAIVSLIRDMANNRYPENYAVSTVQQAQYIPLGKIATLKLSKTYQGAHLQGKIYQLTNCLNHRIILHETEFYRSNTRAITISKHVVASHSTTTIYEISNRA